MTKAIYAHTFQSPHTPYIPRWARNRVYQALACKPEEVVECLTLVLFGKKKAHLVKNQKQVLSLLGHYATMTIDDDVDTPHVQRSLLSVARNPDTRTSVARHAIDVTYESAIRGPLHGNTMNTMGTLVQALPDLMTDRHIARPVREHLFATYCKTIPKVRRIKEIMPIIPATCLNYLEANVPTNRDEINVVSLFESLAEKGYYEQEGFLSALFQTTQKMVSDGTFFSPVSHKRAIKLLLNHGGDDERHQRQELCAKLLTQDNLSADLAPATIKAVASGKYYRDTYPKSVQLLPDVFRLASKFDRDAAPYHAAVEAARELTNPETLETFLRDDRLGYDLRPTSAQRLGLRQAFIDVSARSKIPAPVRQACRAVVDVLDAMETVKSTWAKIGYKAGQIDQTMP